MSTRPVIKVKRLPHGECIVLPHRMTEGSSGADIRAAVDSTIELRPGRREMIPTGLSFEIPRGYEVQIRPRSGLAAKYGVTVLNTPGTIDADYRGEVKIILINLGIETFLIRRGDRIAQAVTAAVAIGLRFEEVEILDQTERGGGGFGHTGV